MFHEARVIIPKLTLIYILRAIISATQRSETTYQSTPFSVTQTGDKLSRGEWSVQDGSDECYTTYSKVSPETRRHDLDLSHDERGFKLIRSVGR